MELQVINEQGKPSARVAASDNAFGRDYNESLIHQLITENHSTSGCGEVHEHNEETGNPRKAVTDKGNLQDKDGEHNLHQQTRTNQAPVDMSAMGT